MKGKQRLTRVEGAIDDFRVPPQANHAELGILRRFQEAVRMHCSSRGSDAPTTSWTGQSCAWIMGAAMALISSMLMKGCSTFRYSGGVMTWRKGRVAA
jgi:hypothetical protein